MPTQSSLTQHSPFRATYKDVLDAPPHMVAEVLEGKLYMNPRPALEHGSATFILLMNLAIPYQRGISGPGGWRFIHEPEIHLDDHVLVPDGAAWLDERFPEGMYGPHTSIPPDWACETLSPSTRKVDLTKKRDIYARHGVQNLWFLDPDKLALEALAFHDGAYLSQGLLQGKQIVSLSPFEVAVFPLSDLWPGNGSTSAQ